jgi:RNA polymerase I-specific transcription initiation factor RRN7
LGLDYSFPATQPRIRAIDHPEILLVSIVVLATQYCFPFEDVGLPDQHGTYVQIPQMDWAKWEELMAPIMNRARDSEELDYKTVTAADITNMTPEQLEKYFTHMSLQLDNAGKSHHERRDLSGMRWHGKGDENDTAFLSKFFPTEKARPFPPQEEDTDQAVNTRAVDVQEQAVAFGKSSVEQQHALERYYSYKRLEDLPPHGRMFYDLAARLAGLSSLSLLKAVNMLELQVRAWKRRQVLLEVERRQVRESREGGIDEGPPNPDDVEVLQVQEDDETVVNTS